MSEEISFIKKVATQGKDKRLILVPKDLFDYIKPKDLCKVTKIKKRKVKTNRCEKCNKQLPITVPPYQRLNWIDDICLCDEEDPIVKWILKKRKKTCKKCGAEFIPDPNYPKQEECQKCLDKHAEKEHDKILKEIF